MTSHPSDPATPIDSFSGEYRFLSNFYPAKVRLDMEEYPTVEHAYQAAKTISPSQRALIRNAERPGDAKYRGRNVTLRPHWETIKRDVMRGLIAQKFQDPELRRRLIATGTRELIEGNYWNDTYWGVCRGNGQNWLGRILMEVRAEVLRAD